jgi:predicted transcriptional regulator of viral defense system
MAKTVIRADEWQAEIARLMSVQPKASKRIGFTTVEAARILGISRNRARDMLIRMEAAGHLGRQTESIPDGWGTPRRQPVWVLVKK